jgi:hypothetical protein
VSAVRKRLNIRVESRNVCILLIGHVPARLLHIVGNASLLALLPPGDGAPDDLLENSFNPGEVVQVLPCQFGILWLCGQPLRGLRILCRKLRWVEIRLRKSPRDFIRISPNEVWVDAGARAQVLDACRQCGCGIGVLHRGIHLFTKVSRLEELIDL